MFEARWTISPWYAAIRTLFWAFTEALLACYDAQEEGSVMVREPLQRGHRAWMAALSQVAVGEGATAALMIRQYLETDQGSRGYRGD